MEINITQGGVWGAGLAYSALFCDTKCPSNNNFR